MNTRLSAIQLKSSKMVIQEPLFGHEVAEVFLFLKDIFAFIFRWSHQPNPKRSEKFPLRSQKDVF